MCFLLLTFFEMKQTLEKFQNIFLEGLEKLENENIEEAIKKFKEASVVFSETIDKTKEENLEKKMAEFFESETGKETLKKYADFYVSAENMEGLKAEISQFSQSLASLEKNFSELKKEKEADDKIISESLDKVFETLDKIGAVTISKIED